MRKRLFYAAVLVGMTVAPTFAQINPVNSPPSTSSKHSLVIAMPEPAAPSLLGTDLFLAAALIALFRRRAARVRR